MSEDVGNQLWCMHIGQPTSILNQLVDLAKLTPRDRELERKYRQPTKQSDIQKAVGSLFSRVVSYILERGDEVEILDITTFVGIDLYYILTKGGAGVPISIPFRSQSAAAVDLQNSASSGIK